MKYLDEYRDPHPGTRRGGGDPPARHPPLGADGNLRHLAASVIGFLKGKSAIAIARMCGKEKNSAGEHFWARGYAVSTVGFELEQVRGYIREQEAAVGNGGQFC